MEGTKKKSTREDFSLQPFTAASTLLSPSFPLFSRSSRPIVQRIQRIKPTQAIKASATSKRVGAYRNPRKHTLGRRDLHVSWS